MASHERDQGALSTILQSKIFNETRRAPLEYVGVLWNTSDPLSTARGAAGRRGYAGAFRVHVRCSGASRVHVGHAVSLSESTHAPPIHIRYAAGAASRVYARYTGAASRVYAHYAGIRVASLRAHSPRSGL